jgi:DNA replication protein DnaC
MAVDLAKEHELGLHASFRPHTCTACFPDGPPPEVVQTTPATPAVETTAPAEQRRQAERQRGEGFEPLRAALERFRARITVDQPSPPSRDPSVADDGLPTCSTCASRRWLRRDVDPDDARFGVLIECPSCAHFLAQRRLERFWRSMPDGYRRFTLEAYPRHDPAQRRSLALVHEWLGAAEGLDGAMWLYLWGDTGRGKTGLAVAATAARGGSALFVTVPDLLVRLAGTYDREAGERDQPRELQLLEQLWSVPTLILDDIGAESPTPWAAQRLYQVINARSVERHLVTIVTSNLSTNRLAAHLNRANPEHGGRTVSRIVGRSHPYVVEVAGPDLRLRGLVRSM